MTIERTNPYLSSGTITGYNVDVYHDTQEQNQCKYVCMFHSKIPIDTLKCNSFTKNAMSVKIPS